MSTLPYLREINVNNPSWRGVAGKKDARPRLLACALSAIGVLLPGTGIAAGNEVQLLSEQYATNLSVSYLLDGQHGGSSQSASAATPLDKSLQGPGDILATANADLFAASASTTAHGNPPLNLGAANAQSSATTTLTFMASSASSSPLSLDYLDDGLPFYTFSADLFDVTAQQDVFTLSWSFGNGPSPLQGASGAIALGMPLVASHVYSLVLAVSTGAADDSESLSLDVSGLDPVAGVVPEPGSSASMLAGLAALAFVARRARQRSDAAGRRLEHLG